MPTNYNTVENEAGRFENFKQNPFSNSKFPTIDLSNTS